MKLSSKDDEATKKVIEKINKKLENNIR